MLTGKGIRGLHQCEMEIDIPLGKIVYFVAYHHALRLCLVRIMCLSITYTILNVCCHTTSKITLPGGRGEHNNINGCGWNRILERPSPVVNIIWAGALSEMYIFVYKKNDFLCQSSTVSISMTRFVKTSKALNKNHKTWHTMMRWSWFSRLRWAT